MNIITQENMLSFSDLKNHYIEGCKSPDSLKVGVEWEKIGIESDTGKAISYSGPRGVATIFERLIQRYHWQAVKQDNFVIALKKDDMSITLEPGGQIELSGRQAFTLHENEAEFKIHLGEIKKVSQDLNIYWLGIGTQPFSALDDIEWVPKKRYDIMRHALKQGDLTHYMMKTTASIQVSIDYTSLEDAARKFVLANKLSPVLAALYSNSPITQGKLNGYESYRGEIWNQTAPERSGLINSAFASGFTVEDYIHHALNVPMLFIIRNQEWIPMNGLIFSDFMKQGFQGHEATADDWQFHLTTIFTDVRLKKYIEIRNFDCQRADVAMSAVAMIKGIFYDESSLAKTENLLSWLGKNEAMELKKQAPKQGLNVKTCNKDLWEISKKLFEIADEGLKAIAENCYFCRSESHYLDALRQLLSKQMTPAMDIQSGFKDVMSLPEKIQYLQSKCGF